MLAASLDRSDFPELRTRDDVNPAEPIRVRP